MSLLFDDASSQYCQVGSPTIAGFPFAIGGWVYLDDISIDQALFSIADPLVEDNFHEVFFQGSGAAQVVARTSAGSIGDASSATTLSLNQWHHVMGIWRGVDSREIYVDGANFASDATSIGVSSLAVSALGRLSKLTPSQHVSGRLAEWAIYETTMPTTVEVDELAQGFSPLLINADNLKHQWRVLGAFDPQDLINNFDLVRNAAPVEAPHAPVLYPSYTQDPGFFGFSLFEAESFLGEAFTEGFVGAEFPQADMVGEAFVTGESEQFTFPLNPTLAGDLVDVGNNSVFRLTVNSTLLDFLVDPFDVEDLSVSYDGRELAFSQITGIDSQSFFNEHLVTLDIDFTGTGSALERIFTGAVRQVELNGENNNEFIQYTAFGNQQLANDVTCINTDGRPSVTFTVGSTVTSVTSAGTPITFENTKLIGEAIQELFEIHNTLLGSSGIPSTIGVPGLSQFNAQLPETVELTNVGFTTAIAQLAAFQPGVKVFWDDLTQKWTFPNIQTVPTAVININSMNVMGLPYTLDTDDRFTAIRLFANVDDALDDAIISKTGSITINGKPGSIQRTTLSLEPLWLPELEPDWTIFKAMQPNPFTLETEFFWVYRRWRIPDDIIKPWLGTPVNVMQKVNNWGVVGWQRLHGRANFGRREFTARFPAIHRGNPMIPGDVIGPLEVELTYYPIQFNFSFTSTINSAGTPTIVNTAIDQAGTLDTIRIPAAGFEGTAFDKFGVERELVQVTDRTEVNTANAQAILNMHKDVIISGDINVDGDPLPSLIHLGKKVLVQHDTRLTGIESLPGLCTQYRYQFGKRGQSTITLTTDIAGLIRTQ